MKNSWLVWLFVVGVIVTVFIAFNYQGGDDTIPLSEIFPENENMTVEVEYEFVDEDTDTTENRTQEIVAAIKNKEEKKSITKLPAEVKTTVQKETDSAKVAETSSKPKLTLENVVYTIQVASFKDKIRADQSITELKDKGYDAYSIPRNLGEKGTWHRVYVGQFTTKEQAKEFLTTIKKDYENSFIIAPKGNKS